MYKLSANTRFLVTSGGVIFVRIKELELESLHFIVTQCTHMQTRSNFSLDLNTERHEIYGCVSI